MSSLIAVLMSSIHVQTATSTAELIVCMLMLIPAMSWPLFSVLVLGDLIQYI